MCYNYNATQTEYGKACFLRDKYTFFTDKNVCSLLYAYPLWGRLFKCLRIGMELHFLCAASCRALFA